MAGAGLRRDDGERFPDLFARYADRVAVALGDLVDFWITFNEPSQLTFGYIKPWWQNRYYMPPGLPRGSDVDAEAEAVGKLVPNLFLGACAGTGGDQVAPTGGESGGEPAGDRIPDVVADADGLGRLPPRAG